MRFSLRPPVVLPLLSLLALGACDAGQTDPVDQEPEVATMIMEVNQGVQFTASSTGFNLQTLTINNLGFTINSAEFRRADGNPETIINLEDFRLAVAGDADGGPLPAGVVFTRSGPFSGNVAGIQEGQTIQVFISLYHIEPEHNDFGPVALTVTRPEPVGGGGEE
jgi:hypothetical protein